VNDTIDGNIATNSNGGAFFVTGGSMATAGTLTNCTVANNQAQNTVEYQSYGGATFGMAFEWNNCIVDDNTDNDNNGRQSCDHAGPGANSIQWPDSGAISMCATNITYADPMLGALADNGGPTMTMIPAAAASVTRIGTGCPATDQTGHPRATPCTIGAYEAR
jgi:hypothetical protein